MQKVLESGAILDVSICSFTEGTKLMKAVSKEIKNTPISLGTNVADFFKAEVSSEILNTMKNIITSLLSSEDIEAALWPCMERGTYTVGGVIRKINRDLFEDEKTRADYVPVLKEVLVYNLTPFFGGLKSLVKSLPVVGIGTQK